MGLLSSLFGQSNGEEALKRAISVASSNNEDLVPTRIPWWEAEKFAQDRGCDVRYDTDMIFVLIPMLINSIERNVLFQKNKKEGTTYVSVMKLDPSNDEMTSSITATVESLIENHERLGENFETKSTLSFNDLKKYFTNKINQTPFLTFIGENFIETSYPSSLYMFRIYNIDGKKTKWITIKVESKYDKQPRVEFELFSLHKEFDVFYMNFPTSYEERVSAARVLLNENPMILAMRWEVSEDIVEHRLDRVRTTLNLLNS